MGTRSAVRLTGMIGGHLDLYRHWDGYPAFGGGTLLTALRGTSHIETVAGRLLGEMDEATSFGRPERHVYEITNADDHGDLEHVYVVTRDRESGWKVAHYARNGWGGDTDDWHTWPHQDYTAVQFVEVVNRDRREINARIKARGLAGGADDEYDMLAPWEGTLDAA